MSIRSAPLRTTFVLSALAALAAGCATPLGSIETLERHIETQETHTARGEPIKITSISVPDRSDQLQVASGAAWTIVPSMSGMHETIRIDARTYQVTALPRPFTAGMADLLVGERSIWFSDGVTRFTGNGDLYRVDIDTNRIRATVEGAGTPFADVEGTVWAYNWRTRTVTGIDTKTNQVRSRIVTQGRGEPRYFAFGEGSIWQFATEGEVSTWQLVRGAAPPSLVRRIDPQTNKVIAQIPVGPYRAWTGIYFVANAVWVLGDRHDRGGAVATRIDPAANRIAAEIALPSSTLYAPVNALPQTPVFWDGGIWISVFVAGNSPSLLVKIDPRTNLVADEISLPISKYSFGGETGAILAGGEGALWAIGGARHCFSGSLRTPDCRVLRIERDGD